VRESSSATDPRPAAAEMLPAECVVVNSGIAQGTIFPQAARERAAASRPRDIRSTTEGSVSGALIAAAEYGRERDGYGKLEELEAWLADDLHLQALFQARRATRPLLIALLSLERRGRTPTPGRGLAAMIRAFWALFPGWIRILFDAIPGALRDALPLHYWSSTVLGMGVGGTIDVLLARGLVDASHPVARAIVAIALPVMFVGAYAASLGACAWRLWRSAATELALPGDGLCTGMEATATADGSDFTSWLHRSLQGLAGLPVAGPPLTFGMLRSKRHANERDAAGIEWRCVTSSLALAEPVVWPEAAADFLVREADVRAHFPAVVTGHLLAAAARAVRDAEVSAGYLALPAVAELPVIVVARIATDLPVLLGAIPLYLRPGARGRLAAIGRAAAGDPEAPRRLVFGRGVLVSSPERLLEAWLPARPCFGLPLTQAARHEASARIAMAEGIVASSRP